MAKTQKVEKLAVVLPDGTTCDVDSSVVKKYALKAGGITPFSRIKTSSVVRNVQQKSSPKDWAPEDDSYLLEHWPTVTRVELARRLSVSPTAMTKRYKQLVAKQEAENKKKKKKPSSTRTTKGKTKPKKTK